MAYTFYLIIPCSLSILSCTIFLFYFCKYEAVRLTFLMNYMATLQALDLLLSLSIIFPLFLLQKTDAYCQAFSFSAEFFLIFQSYWIAIISIYVYKVLCQKKDRHSYSLFHSILICFSISVLPATLTLSLQCFKIKNNRCVYVQTGLVSLIDKVLFVFVHIFGFIVSGVYNVLLLKWLKNNFKTLTRDMKWTFVRIAVYPYITFLCVLPILLNNQFLPANDGYELFCDVLYQLNGFFYSIALGFTKEFRDAVKFHKNKSLLDSERELVG